MSAQPTLAQRPAAPKPLASGWDYACLSSPQTHRRNEPGRFASASAKRRPFETNDDYRERCRLAR